MKENDRRGTGWMFRILVTSALLLEGCVSSGTTTPQPSPTGTPESKKNSLQQQSAMEGLESQQPHLRYHMYLPLIERGAFHLYLSAIFKDGVLVATETPTPTPTPKPSPETSTAAPTSTPVEATEPARSTKTSTAARTSTSTFTPEPLPTQSPTPIPPPSPTNNKGY